MHIPFGLQRKVEKNIDIHETDFPIFLVYMKVLANGNKKKTIVVSASFSYPKNVWSMAVMVQAKMSILRENHCPNH